MSEVKSVVVGYGSCPICDHPETVKANKKGHLYIYCSHVADGGCQVGTTSRSDAGDERLAARVRKWVKPEYRAAFSGDGGADLDLEPDDDDDDEILEAEIYDDDDDTEI
jgi:hypothetical protein